MRNTSNFSLIIPTFTGEDHIDDCLESVLVQNNIANYNFEVIVIIDGPNYKLEKIVATQKNRFTEQQIDFRVFKFKKNKGRFEARLKGAQEAKYPNLLFLDDRNILAGDYFEQVVISNKRALIPNVLETDHPHFIARTIYLLRKKIYKGAWGKDFKSYNITPKNFERSSKGTTSFWVKKDIFITACHKVSSQYDDLKSISEDTKIMREIVDNHTPIFRSSEAKIYYQPRASVKSEIWHIYHRGPRFIDYYLKPGTRFFFPLLASLTLPLIVLVLWLTAPVLLAVGLLCLIIMDIVMAIFVSNSAQDFLTVSTGLPILLMTFYTGILIGVVRKLTS